MYTYMHADMHANMHAERHAYMHAYTNTYIYIYVYVHSYTQTCACIYMRIGVNLQRGTGHKLRSALHLEPLALNVVGSEPDPKKRPSKGHELRNGP